MNKNKIKLLKMICPALVALLLVSACNSPENEEKKISKPTINLNNEKVEIMDFDTSEIKSSIDKSGEILGISNVKSIKINENIPINQADIKKENNNRSNCFIMEKKLQLDKPYILDQILAYIVESENNKAPKNDKIIKRNNKINKTLKAVSEGKLKPAKGIYTNHEDYPYYRDAKRINPKKFNPYLEIKGEDSSKIYSMYNGDVESYLVVNKNFSDLDTSEKYSKDDKLPSENQENHNRNNTDSQNNIINQDEIEKYDQWYNMNSKLSCLISNLLSAEIIDTNIPKDVYTLAKKNNLFIQFRDLDYELTLASSLKENTFSNRKSLYTAYVNDLIKSSSFPNGLGDYLGKKIKLERYFIISDKSETETYNFSPGQYLLALRHEDKLIGGFIVDKNSSYNLNFENYFEKESIPYETWLENNLAFDEEAKKLAILSEKDIIKQFIDYQNEGKARESSGLLLPALYFDDWINEDTSSMQNSGFPYSAYKVDIISLVKIDNLHQEEFDHNANKINTYKLTAKLTDKKTKNTRNEEIYINMIKLSDNFGYRILSFNFW